MYIFKMNKVNEYVTFENLTGVTFEIHDDATLAEMLINFEAFLKAAGFHFDGSLTISEPEIEAELSIDLDDECNLCECEQE